MQLEKKRTTCRERRRDCREREREREKIWENLGTETKEWNLESHYGASFSDMLRFWGNGERKRENNAHVNGFNEFCSLADYIVT